MITKRVWKFNAYVWAFCAAFWGWFTFMVRTEPVSLATAGIGLLCFILALYATIEHALCDETEKNTK